MLAAGPQELFAKVQAAPRHLHLHHAHTGESLEVVYRRPQGYSSQALKRLNHFLRDFRTEESARIDPHLFDLLYDLKLQARNEDGVIEILSGYRAPATNNMLRKKSKGVARHSLHMEGKALDIRLRGTSTCRLRDAAIDLARGGVGYYRRSDFVHVDTGTVRTW